MLRVKVVKDYKTYKKGEVLHLSPNEAFGLIDSGQAIITKDIVPDDYKSKALDEEQANGKTDKRKNTH